MIRMLRTIGCLLAALYCFVWLRIPEDVLGVVLPVQRLAGWLGLVVVLAALLFDVAPGPGRLARGYLGAVVLFVVYLGVDFLLRFLGNPGVFNAYFDLPLFASDVAKYLASFASAYVVYFTLRRHSHIEHILIRLLLLSGSLSIALAYGFLFLYFQGFTTDNEVLAHTFGGYLGVWETDGVLPRLAGTTAEPQQFAIVFLTPLLLMLSSRYIGRFWPIALTGVAALAISQSKFSIVSILLVLVYVFWIYRRFRLGIVLGSAVLLPPVGYYIATLPTFNDTFSDLLVSGAVVERASNAGNLVSIILANLFTGIGAGQYGPFVGYVAMGNKDFLPKTYYPNFDFLKIFAETGLIGFGLVVAMLVRLFGNFFRALALMADEGRERLLALLLGAIAIVLNMFIGYEFLHVFFWVNVGFLMFLAERAFESTEPATADPSRAEPDNVGAYRL
jgi:hypothetical protein